MDTIHTNSPEEFTNINLSMPSSSFSLEEFMTKAETYAEQEDFPNALKVYHQILDEIDVNAPNLFEVYKNMGNMYLKCGDFEAAEEKYNQANAIDSQDENLIINYGVLAIQRGEFSEAKSRFAEILNQTSGNDLAWVGMGLVHRAHADNDLARACLLRGLDENPFNKLAITNYYQWCLQDGIDASEEILNQFLTEFPEDCEINKLASGLNQ